MYTIMQVGIVILQRIYCKVPHISAKYTYNVYFKKYATSMWYANGTIS